MGNLTLRITAACLMTLLLPLIFCSCGSSKSRQQDNGSVKALRTAGEVRQVDADAGTVLVNSIKGDILIHADKKTRILINRKEKKISDIKSTDKVRITYIEDDGKNIAKKITVR